MTNLALGLVLGSPALRPAAIPDEAETTALVARFTTPPTAARKALINTFIKALKTANVWSELDVIWWAGADSQCTALNWKADAYNLTAFGTGAPTFTIDRGFTGNGDDAMDSNFNPTTAVSANYLQDDACFGMFELGTGTSGTTDAGYFSGTQGTTINPRTAGNDITIRINQAATFSTTGGLVSDASGLVLAVRTGASAIRIDKNGAQAAAGTTASAALANGNLRWGTIGNSTWATRGPIAGGVIGGALDATKSLAFYNAARSYLQGIGAVV